MAASTDQGLEARVRELEDVRAVTDLFFKWHYECTGGFAGKEPGRMAALECLTDDATIEILGLHKPGQGPTGRKEYTEFWDYYYGTDGPLPYVFQSSCADKVEVNGDSAVHKTNMVGIFQARGDDGKLHKASIGLSQRTNHCVRTPQGWRIRKTTMEGSINIEVEQLSGMLNKLPEPMKPRTPWTYKG